MVQDPYRYFRVEARELLEQLGQGVLDLERGAPPELVTRMFRWAHTLKGAARVVKQRDIADQTHALEDELAVYRESTTPVPRSEIDALLARLDLMSGGVTALDLPQAPEATAEDRLQRPIEPPLRMMRTEVAELDELLDGLGEVYAHLQPLRKGVAAMERAAQLVESLSAQPLGPAPREYAAGTGRASDESVRMASEDLTALMDTIKRAVASGVDQIDRELRQVRAVAERMRLVPAGAMFAVLERTARDVALAMGRSVVFVGEGADVRLDAAVVGAMQPGLVQLVRNAVAHGIESPEIRKAAGKPIEGRVTLEVARRGRSVHFTCTDDGGGVDLAAVRLLAQRKGLLSAETRSFGPEELLRALLKGGISTAGTVTAVSGRGVGLDVVREAAESLGGTVSIRTEPGKGTAIEVVVPLSLASVQGLIVEESGTTAAIPLEAVRQTLRIGADQIVRTPEGESIVHKGKIIPFVPLSGSLSIRRSAGRRVTVRTALIVEGEGGLTAAIGVDRLLGTATLVLRPLPDLAPASGVVAGASLDLEGNPQLVLDPCSLVANAFQPSSAPVAEPELRRAPILVIDDSLTTRMLEQSILESAGYDVEVAASGEEALEKAGRKPYALFLVDIEMPGIDGFTFIERARREPALREIPAILVSSRAAPEDRLRGEEVGAAAYVVKGEFDQNALLARIRTLVA
jgi:two-component system chemotaxis sensor kinase CheA